MRVQAARSFFCRAESASVADSAEWVLVRRGGEPGDLRSNRVHGRETTHPFHGGHRRHDWEEVQAARSFFCRAESASVADSAECFLAQRSGESGDLRLPLVSQLQ